MSIVIGVHQRAQLARNFDAQSLNPQPSPSKDVGFQLFHKLNSQALLPKELSGLLGSLFKPRFPNTLDKVALSPQPLPPSPPPDRFTSLFRFSNALDEVALNPQPLPPGPPPDRFTSLFRFSNTLDKVALNPQPLPPGPPPDEGFAGRVLNTLDEVALNPQPLPPGPPPLALNLVLASRNFIIR